jgi:hypothetical protein
MKYIQPPKIVQYRSNTNVEVHINSSSDVYYTTNGHIPTKLSTKYTNPIQITKNTNFLIIAYNQSDDSYSRVIEYFAEVPKSYRDNLVDSTIYNKKE